MRRAVWSALAVLAIMTLAWLDVGAPYPGADRAFPLPPLPRLHGVDVIPARADGQVDWAAAQPHLGAPRVVAGTPFVLRTDADADPAQRAAVERGLRTAQDGLRHWGAAIRGRTAVRLVGTPACDGRLRRVGPVLGRAEGLTRGHEICLFETRTMQRPLNATMAAAHEAVHVAQTELGCTTRGRRLTPAWFIEGMAEALSTEALLSRGVFDDAARRALAGRVVTGRSPRPLRAYEQTTYRLDYGQAQRATYLAAGGRFDRLVAFCAAVGRGRPWRSAFRTTFGRAVESVYRAEDRLGKR